MKKKAYALFCVLVLLLGMAGASVGRTSGSAEYVAAAAGQSLYRLDVVSARGTIYDCRLRPLVSARQKLTAAVAPTIETVGLLEKATGGKYRELLASALESGKPFLLETEPEDALPESRQIDLFRVPVRYTENQLAPHVIGYLDSLGRGASGIELAMNDVLESRRGFASVTYEVDALGRVIAGGEKQLVDTLEKTEGGVVLTLDSDLQRLAQNAGHMLEKGAVVITEVPGCEVRAMASFPDFSPLDLGEAARSEDGALLNRAFCAYPPGSVFKLVPAGLIAEKGNDALPFTCIGALNAGGMDFHCYGGFPHGTVDLKSALEKSCNCYFIGAVRSLGGQEVLSAAYDLGLGTSQEFGRGLFTEPGTLPDAASLLNARALANFSFGQGEITVTPLQLCGLVNTAASGGVYSSPRLILGTTDGSGEVREQRAITEKTVRILSENAAGKLRAALEGAVLEGTAKPGAPENCTAGVKTGTAQTGRYENGRELLHFWYCGYVCDEEGPRYCITVLRESVPDDEGVTALVFRRLAEGLGERMKNSAGK